MSPLPTCGACPGGTWGACLGRPSPGQWRALRLPSEQGTLAADCAIQGSCGAKPDHARLAKPSRAALATSAASATRLPVVRVASHRRPSPSQPLHGPDTASL